MVNKIEPITKIKKIQLNKQKTSKPKPVKKQDLDFEVILEEELQNK